MIDSYRTGRPSLTKGAIEADRRKYLQARAEKESALAALAELDWQRKSALFVPRAEVAEANQIALQLIDQHLRRIPAEAAQRLAVTPVIEAEMQHLIDEALAGLAVEMMKFSQQHHPTRKEAP